MNLQDIAALIAVISFIGAILAWAFKRWVLDIMTAHIVSKVEERTYPIQPGANGGNSLPDAIKLIVELKREFNERFDKIEDRQINIGDITTANNALLANHLDWHNQRD